MKKTTMHMFQLELKELLLATCCSFTISVITIAMLENKVSLITLDAIALQQMLVLCVTTSLVIRLIFKINFSYAWLGYAMSYLGMNITVYGLGTYVFGLIPLEISIYVVVFIMGIVIYLFCMMMLMMTRKNEADMINQKLSEHIFDSKSKEDK